MYDISKGQKMDDICYIVFDKIYNLLPAKCKIRLITDGCKSEFKANLFIKRAMIENWSFDFVASTAHHMAVLEGGCDAAHWQLRRTIQSKFDEFDQKVSIKNNRDLYDFCHKYLQGLHGNLFYIYDYLEISGQTFPDTDPYPKFKLLKQKSKLDITTTVREKLSATIHRLEAYCYLRFDSGKMKACPFYKFEEIDVWTLKNLTE